MSKKQWTIKEPVPTKMGSWYGFVIDPTNSQVVYELFDISKQMCLNTCINWCITMNNILESEELENAKSNEMGSTLVENSSGSFQTI